MIHRRYLIGFCQCICCVEYANNMSVLHPRLEETIKLRQAPKEFIQEANSQKSHWLKKSLTNQTEITRLTPVKMKRDKPMVTLRETCPDTELFLVRIFLFSVQINKNMDQNNSVTGSFSRSVMIWKAMVMTVMMIMMILM